MSKTIIYGIAVMAIAATGLGSPLVANADPPVGGQFGKTYGELAASWWQWAIETGASGAPSGPVDCSLGQQGKVWFLGGSFGTPVERACIDSIPRGKALFFPLVNVEVTLDDCGFADPPVPVEDCTVERKRELANGIFSDLDEDALELGFFGVGSYTCQLSAFVDGEPVQHTSPIVRTQSPTFALDDSVAGIDPEAVADGWWVAIPPLSKGEHTITFTGAVCDIGAPPTAGALFRVDVIYHLTVGR